MKNESSIGSNYEWLINFIKKWIVKENLS